MARADFLGDEYDPERIVTTASDEKGHSANLRVHVPTFWHSVMNQKVQSSEWPEYRSIQDCVRDAIFHRMHWWSEQTDRESIPHVREAIFQQQMRDRIQMADFRKTQWRIFIEELEVKITSHIKEGNRAEVISILEDLGERLWQIDEPYRTKVNDLIEVWTRRANFDWND